MCVHSPIKKCNVINTSDHMPGREIWIKLPVNFKIFKNRVGELSPKFPEPNMVVTG